jgi:hypothetical protein
LSGLNDSKKIAYDATMSRTTLWMAKHRQGQDVRS